jgi:hypothetical protein
VCKRDDSLAMLEKQCFQLHFQDILSTRNLLNIPVKPTIIYGLKIWGPDFAIWSGIEWRGSILVCFSGISVAKGVPQNIVHAEFGTYPLCLKNAFRFVTYLHRVRRMEDSSLGKDGYPFMTLFSSSRLVSLVQTGQCPYCFIQACSFLKSNSFLY